MNTKQKIQQFKRFFSGWNRIGQLLALIRIDEDHENRLARIENYLSEEDEFNELLQPATHERKEANGKKESISSNKTSQGQ